MGKAHRIHAAVNNRQAKHQSTVLEATGKINGMKFSLLVDPGTTEIFISYEALSICKVMASKQDDFNMVEMASGITQRVGELVKDCEVDLGMCVTKVSLYATALGSYDIILGMDWLETHSAMLDCKEKKLIFIDDFGHKRILIGTRRGVSLRFISTLQLKKSMRKGCELYVVVVMNNKKDTVDVSQHPILSQFADVFPEELPRLPPKREIDFTIELKPGIEPISRVPYRMMTPKFK